jgi:hypothetical protein
MWKERFHRRIKRKDCGYEGDKGVQKASALDKQLTGVQIFHKER